MGSNSWVKGVQESKDWCENNLEYEMVGLSPEQFLDKLAQAKGCALNQVGLILVRGL